MRLTFVHFHIFSLLSNIILFYMKSKSANKKTEVSRHRLFQISTPILHRMSLADNMIEILFGIIGLTLAVIGLVIAYKQLKHTRSARQ